MFSHIPTGTGSNTMDFSAHHLAIIITLMTFTTFLKEVDGLLVRPPALNRCPPRVLTGGRVRVRSKGRVVKYVCLRGSQVLGDKYSTCVHGRWDSPVPVCINTGCLPVDVPHAQVLETYRGALVTVHCDLGYSLVGSQSLYCNGAVWNGTAPICKETQNKAKKWCDFEDEDLCGWTHDSNHDFDWRRNNFATPSGYVGTGPSCDHTLGPSLDGHYMYLEVSSPRVENDTARLFSPVFNAIADSGACFIFWYHMYGATIGTLNVYLHKQDTVQLFTQSGDRGDAWHQAVLPLPPVNSSFQIVIEGVRGSGYDGDIAIDDVKLSEGQECAVTTTDTSDDELVTSTMTVEVYSNCEGRCFVPATEPSMCECTPDCVGNNTCCLDYVKVCTKRITDETRGTEFTTVKLIASSQDNLSNTEAFTTASLHTRVTAVSAEPRNNSVTSIPSNSSTANESQTEKPTQKTEQSNSSSTFSTKSSSSNTTTRIISPPTTQLPTTRNVSVVTAKPDITVAKPAITAPKPAVTAKPAITVAKPAITAPKPAVTEKPAITVAKPAITAPKPAVTAPKPAVIAPKPDITAKPAITLPKPAITAPTTVTTNQSVITTVTFNVTSSTAIAAPTSPSRKSSTVGVTTKVIQRLTTPDTKPSVTVQKHPLPNPFWIPRKPKLQFVTPIPPVVFRKPAKPLKPLTQSTLNDSVVPITSTTPKLNLMINVTVKVPKYKNDIWHPVWLKDTLPTPTLPPLGEHPEIFNNTSTASTTSKPSTTSYFRRSKFRKPTNETKWKSTYKSNDESPVHAQYAVETSTPDWVFHAIVMVSGVLLLLSMVLATVCVLRRRKVNRKRTEDDELDIQFLASDEILDFTWARPSLEDIQMSETRR